MNLFKDNLDIDQFLDSMGIYSVSGSSGGSPTSC